MPPKETGKKVASSHNMALRGHESEKEHVDLPEIQQMFMDEIMNRFQSVILNMERKFKKKMEDQRTQTEGSIREAFGKTENNLKEVMERLPLLGGQNQIPMPDQQQIRQFLREMIPALGGVNVAMDDVEVPPPPLGVDNVLERQDPVLPIEEVADNVNEVNQAEIGVYVPPHVRGNGVGNGHQGIHNGHNGHNGARNGGNGNANGNGNNHRHAAPRQQQQQQRGALAPAHRAPVMEAF
ncbi:hypothetical protein COLO4_24751, partial [Corchorus olitorius]